MADPKRDPQVVAVENIFAALKSLDADSRRKVLASVSALLEIPPSDVAPASFAAHPQKPMNQSPDSGTRVSSRPMSLVEVMQDKTPHTYPEKLAVFAYYRERYEGKPRFDRTTLREYFSRAKEAPPGNYDRDFNKTVKFGWIHEDGEESYLTSKGVEAVETGFSGGKRLTESKKKKKVTKKRTKRGRQA